MQIGVFSIALPAATVLGILAITAPDTPASAQSSLFGERFASSRAEPGASAWDKALTSRMRLIAARTSAMMLPGEEALEAGVEITLDPRWKTYWSSPGDTGIAPMFSFDRSVNVASVDVAYPMPDRFDYPGDISFGYETQVVFPLTVTPEDPSESVELVADVMYGACEELCIPVEAQATLSLPGAVGAVATGTGAVSQFAGLLADWRSRVPAEHDAALESVSATMKDHATFLEIVVAAPSDFTDPVLIAEPNGGEGRVYLGSPTRTLDQGQASFVFPVKTRRKHAGLEAGV
ncbi:MAG: protein-disulfide reductase DsbD domain-containing protein, partial [Pseudomonadota bacterium]